MTDDLPGFRPLLVVTVRGEPIPQGSKIPFMPRGGGRPMLRDDNAATLKPWRRAIAKVTGEAAAYARDLGGPMTPYDGALIVDVAFTMPKPKSAPKTRITYPAVRPDVDKLLRACLDGLVDGGVIADDGRVVRVVGEKVYPGEHRRALGEPGMHVVVARYPLPYGVNLADYPAPQVRGIPTGEQEVLSL